MRLVHVLFGLSLLTLPAVSQEAWESRVPVPARVHYKQATAEENRPTVERVQKFFAADGASAEPLSGVALISGPFLWQRVKNLPAMKGQGVPATVRVPGANGEVKLEGRLFHKAPELQNALLSEIRQELATDGGFKVRKLNPQELDLLWSIYGFDLLEDPLLLLESPHHRIMLLFVKGELLQIDDFYQASLPSAGGAKTAGASAGAHPFVQETARRFWSEPHENIEAGKLISGEGIQLLSDDEVIHQSLSTEVFIDYVKQLISGRERALGAAGKQGRNLSIQVELRPDGDFFTVVCTPPLPPAVERKLQEELRRVPHAKLKSTVALQLFCRVWGGSKN